MSQQCYKDHLRFSTSTNMNQKNFKPSFNQRNQSGSSSKNTSKITMESKRTTPNYQTVIDDVDDQEVQPLPSQTEQAKKKVTKLHGINFGRSLTLQEESYILIDDKGKIIRILLIIGLLCIAALYWISVEDESVKKLRNKKRNGIKSKRK